MEPIIEAAQALAGLLRTAAEHGLPTPYAADVTNYAPSGHPAGQEGPEFGYVGSVSLVVTAGELAPWAEWLDAEPYDDGEPYKGNLHRHLNGMAGPIPVQVTALVPVDEQVSA
jgi:hypothetical protein